MYSIGLDVSKSTIAVYISINRQHLEIENSISSIPKSVLMPTKIQENKILPQMLDVIRRQWAA